MCDAPHADMAHLGIAISSRGQSSRVVERESARSADRAVTTEYESAVALMKGEKAIWGP